MPEAYLEAGKIVSVHALKGEVKIMPWCDTPEFLCDFDVLFTDKGRGTLTVESSRVFKNMVIAKFEGYNTVEEAQKLRNKILYIDRNDVELAEGCYFIQDLIGLQVIDADSGKIYGILDDVMQTGANDVYVIKDGEKELLAPAIPDVVIETDIEGGKMLIRPLKGLFDDED